MFIKAKGFFNLLTAVVNQCVNVASFTQVLKTRVENEQRHMHKIHSHKFIPTREAV